MIPLQNISSNPKNLFSKSIKKHIITYRYFRSIGRTSVDRNVNPISILIILFLSFVVIIFVIFYTNKEYFYKFSFIRSRLYYRGVTVSILREIERRSL